MTHSGMTQPARRRGGSPGDMARTVGVFVVIIVGVVALVPRSRQPAVAQPVDYALSLAALRHATPFHVYAPAVAPPGWVANHIRAQAPTGGNTTAFLDLGFYISASDEYAAVEQSTAADWLTTQLGTGARQTGSVLVAGTRYTQYTDSGGHPALVRRVGPSLLVLDGQARLVTLEALAAALS